MTINWLLWLGLFVGYFVLDGVGTKNIIATNNLDRFPAANSSAFMYVLGILGSYICITDGVWNILPIVTGAWLGTFIFITWETIEHKGNKLKEMIQAMRDFFKSKALKKAEELELRVKALEEINLQRAVNRQRRFNKLKKQTNTNA